MLCYAVLCYAMLCPAMPCYALLCSALSSLPSLFVPFLSPILSSPLSSCPSPLPSAPLLSSPHNPLPLSPGSYHDKEKKNRPSFPNSRRVCAWDGRLLRSQDAETARYAALALANLACDPAKQVPQPRTPTLPPSIPRPSFRIAHAHSPLSVEA
eukprot:1072681-Rhodomonas_salina.3